MRRFNPQSNQQELNSKILEKYFVDSYFNDDFTELTSGKNNWLKSFLNMFIHQDTILKPDECRLQGWFKPGESMDHNIFTPTMDVECFSPDFGLYVTIWI